MQSIHVQQGETYYLSNVPLVADWKVTTHTREQKVNENLLRENAKLRSYDYRQGQKVLNLVHKPTKLGSRTFGSFAIKRVHVNENITMELRPCLGDHINVRRVTPYISRTNHGPPMGAIGLFHIFHVVHTTLIERIDLFS